MNDYGMMKFAHISVIMGNTCDELKEIADIVCKNMEQDGIYYAFKEMGLL